jgi:hypothetical protein
LLIEIIECQRKIPGQPGIALQCFRDALRKIGWRDCICGFSLALLANLY